MVKAPIPIFIGGTGADKTVQKDENIKAQFVEDLEKFREMLDGIDT